MNRLPELYPAQLHLLLIPKPARGETANAILTHLALSGMVRVLDGGNCFEAHRIARSLRRQTSQLSAALQRIYVARAFTCYQVFTLLSETPPSPVPTLVLDLLSTFHDESVPLFERRRLLGEVVRQLQRLSRQAPVVVSAAPPKGEDDELARLLEEAADRVLRFETHVPAPTLRLL